MASPLSFAVFPLLSKMYIYALNNIVVSDLYCWSILFTRYRRENRLYSLWIYFFINVFSGIINNNKNFPYCWIFKICPHAAIGFSSDCCAGCRSEVCLVLWGILSARYLTIPVFNF